MDKIPNTPPDLEAAAEQLCPSCHKIQALCVCADIEPVDNRVRVLILQHPQEQDRELGTARLTKLHFRNADLKIGLSWPNLTNAVGRPADPRRWGTLYLGPASLSGDKKDRQTHAAPILVLDRHSKPQDEAAANKALGNLEGIILLDGSWSQAKTLWWRNAWLLKTTRIVLNPASASLYGRVRKEPRRESVSTLEAAAIIMKKLEGNAQIETRMLDSFQALLARYGALTTGWTVKR